MELNNKKCTPCESGVRPLNINEIADHLKSTPGWALADNKKAIVQRFKFKNFKQALEFVNKVGNIAESEGHHPDIEFGWGYASITLQTHSINGLHINDFIVATKINELV